MNFEAVLHGDLSRSQHDARQEGCTMAAGLLLSSLMTDHRGSDALLRAVKNAHTEHHASA